MGSMYFRSDRRPAYRCAPGLMASDSTLCCRSANYTVAAALDCWRAQMAKDCSKAAMALGCWRAQAAEGCRTAAIVEGCRKVAMALEPDGRPEQGLGLGAEAAVKVAMQVCIV